MFKKILATSVLITLLASTAFAETETMSAPGKSLPIASESSEQGIPLLNSAPVAPSASMTLSEITVEPETHEAVFSFSTSASTHVSIEYGLTPEYERSISTEPQTDHTETIGELMECATYYYRVHVGDISREGDFKTLCPKIVVQNTKYKIQSWEKIQSTKNKIQNEEKIVLNAAPEEVQNTSAAADKVQNEEVVIDKEIPQTPSQPILISADATDAESMAQITPETAPVWVSNWLLLFAIFSGAVVVFFAFKKKK